MNEFGRNLSEPLRARKMFHVKHFGSPLPTLEEAWGEATLGPFNAEH